MACRRSAGSFLTKDVAQHMANEPFRKRHQQRLANWREIRSLLDRVPRAGDAPEMAEYSFPRERNELILDLEPRRLWETSHLQAGEMVLLERPSAIEADEFRGPVAPGATSGLSPGTSVRALPRIALRRPKTEGSDRATSGRAASDKDGRRTVR